MTEILPRREEKDRQVSLESGQSQGVRARRGRACKEQRGAGLCRTENSEKERAMETSLEKYSETRSCSNAAPLMMSRSDIKGQNGKLKRKIQF